MTANVLKADTSPVEAVRLVVNTAVLMRSNEPEIDVRSVTESKRGPGILIWIPGYIDKDGTIIAGHGRVAAAKKLGLDTVPCVRLEHLTDAQARLHPRRQQARREGRLGSRDPED